MHKECATMPPHERCDECCPRSMADETLRPQFEAWLNPGRHEGNVSAWVAPGRYEKEAHQLAWLAWQAAIEAVCAAIKAEDDHCAGADYMLDSDDCIKVARGQWVRPEIV